MVTAVFVLFYALSLIKSYDLGNLFNVWFVEYNTKNF